MRLLVARRGVEARAHNAGATACSSMFSASPPRHALLARPGSNRDRPWPRADAVLRLAALAIELPEDAFRLRTGSASPTKNTCTICGRLSGRPTSVRQRQSRPQRSSLYSSGDAAYRERVLITWARSGESAASAPWRERFALAERWPPPKFPNSEAPTYWRLVCRPAPVSSKKLCGSWRVGGSQAASRRTRRCCARSCNGWSRKPNSAVVAIVLSPFANVIPAQAGLHATIVAYAETCVGARLRAHDGGERDIV